MRPGNLFFTTFAVFGLAAVLGAGQARAEDDGVSFDQQIMHSIMDGLGLESDDKPRINYQERAPLVIPPSRDLPPPEVSGAASANNPAWPKDADVERRKREAAINKNRNISDEREREQNPLRPDQLTPGARTKKRQAQTDDGYQAPASGFGSQLSPSELGTSTGSVFGAMFGSKKEETAKFTGEPPRASLTDPPTGYQTPSPDQPYGIGHAPPPKPTDNYTTRGELSR